MSNSLRLILFAAAMAPGVLAAHTPSESFSRWSWGNGNLEIVVTVDAREASRAVAERQNQRLASGLRDYLAANVEPVGGGCADVDATLLPAQTGWFRVRLGWQCESEPAAIRFDAFFDRVAEHQHFTSTGNGGDRSQQLLSTESRVLYLTPPGAGTSVERVSPSYWLAGIFHIRNGYDHLVFLLALVLMFQGFREICIAVTGFTAGHTLSMLLLTLQVVSVRSAAIEALIGLSICLAAVECFRGRHLSRWTAYGVMLGLVVFGAVAKLLLPVTFGWGGLLGIGLIVSAYFGAVEARPGAFIHRYAMIVFFGFLHGFGFATGFIALDVPRDEVLPAVLKFNLGVEAGQLLFIIFAAGLLGWRAVRDRSLARDVVASACLAAGAYWFIARSLAV